MAIKLHCCGGAAHVLPRRRKPGPRRKGGAEERTRHWSRLDRGRADLAVHYLDTGFAAVMP
ncbi:MAG TPA: hypothetical protein VKG87_05555 [Terriglobales bacterium]|nr:hypothetical protein [Terriglobales bacterium]